MLISFECHAKDVLVRGQIVVYDRKFRKYFTYAFVATNEYHFPLFAFK